MTTTDAPAPTQDAKQNNPVGLSAFIVALVAFVFAVIPVLSFIAWLPALAAIVLGIVGLVLKGRKKLFAGLGLGIGALAWIVAIIVSIASVGAAASSISDAIDEAVAETSDATTEVVTEEVATETTGAGTLVYEVTSDGSTIQTISYATATTSGSGQESASAVPSPFVKELQIETGLFDYSVSSLVAQASADATTISCKITLDGEVLSEQTSTGAYSVVSCVGSN